MRMSELNLPTVEFKTNLTINLQYEFNLQFCNNIFIKKFFWKISFIFTQRLKLVCMYMYYH